MFLTADAAADAAEALPPALCPPDAPDADEPAEAELPPVWTRLSSNPATA